MCQHMQRQVTTQNNKRHNKVKVSNRKRSLQIPTFWREAVEMEIGGGREVLAETNITAYRTLKHKMHEKFKKKSRTTGQNLMAKENNGINQEFEKGKRARKDENECSFIHYI